MDNIPYVVSGDIQLLLHAWAQLRDFTLPEPSFFAALRTQFIAFMGAMFPCFEFVPEEELETGMAKLTREADLPVVALDRVYTRDAAAHLDLARLVTKDGVDHGLGHRAGAPLLREQLNILHARGLRNVTLVDDVIFTGDLMARVIRLLEECGVHVQVVCAGIGVGTGIYALTAHGYDVRCVRTFSAVVDEICERDLYPGVPLSGRLLAGSDNIGVPYLLPFGHPASWASIPPGRAAEFSAFCLGLAAELFSEIERCSERTIFCHDLGRRVFSMSTDGVPFVGELRRVRDQINV